MTPGDWTELLQTAGGWGVAVIEGFVLRWLWQRYEASNERIFGLLDKQNDILRALKGREDP